MAIRRWGGWQHVNVGGKLWSAIKTNYHLGFTSFGGPPVHFKIVSCSFVPMIMFHRDVHYVFGQDDC